MNAPYQPDNVALPREIEPSRQPSRIALIFAFLYVVFCALYILISTKIAADISTSVENLESIEVIKGIVFVFATGALYFVVALFFLRKISNQEVRILRQEKALAGAEGRAMAGIFAASISHDIGNLLSVVRINLHLLKPVLDKSDDPSIVANLRAAFEQVSELTVRLSALGRQTSAGTLEAIDLTQLIDKVVSFAPTHSKIRECKVRFIPPGPVHVVLDKTMMMRTLVNLILNAAEATGKGGKIDVRLLRNGDEVHIEVHDNGPGIPEDMREKVFDPFYTSKESGTGLGLLSVKVCAEQLGGKVAINKSDLGGAAFAIIFPYKPTAD